MAEELRRFQVEQRELGVTAPTINSIVVALRFFYTHAHDRPNLARKLVHTQHERKLLGVLSQDEAARLLDATTCLKHQAVLSVAYGAGLHAAEVAALDGTNADEQDLADADSGSTNLSDAASRRCAFIGAHAQLLQLAFLNTSSSLGAFSSTA